MELSSRVARSWNALKFLLIGNVIADPSIRPTGRFAGVLSANVAIYGSGCLSLFGDFSSRMKFPLAAALVALLPLFEVFS
jgi:hypothetical protein